MSNLSAFFAQNVVKKKTDEFVVSEKFKEENGEPVKWEIVSLTANEDEQLRNEHMIEIPNESGFSIPKLDVGGYQAALVAKCVKWPNLNNARSYRTATAYVAQRSYC